MMRATVNDDGRVGVESGKGVWFFRDPADATRIYRVLPGPYGGRRPCAKNEFSAAVLRAIDNYRGVS